MAEQPRLLSEADFRQFLALGREQPGVEFKGPGRSKNASGSNVSPLFAKVMRAILAMSNRRDGGWVIVGVDETPAGPKPVGMPEEDRRSWSYDDLAAKVSEYSDPGVIIDVDHPRYGGAVYVVIQVFPFDDTPTLCAKPYDYQVEGRKERGIVLRRGALYIRPFHGKIESREPRTQEEIRAVLQMGMEKMLGNHLAAEARARQVSTISGVGEVRDPPSVAQFERERGGL